MKAYIETVLLTLSLFGSAKANTIDNCTTSIYEIITIDTSKNPYSDCDPHLKYKLTKEQADSLNRLDPNLEERITYYREYETRDANKRVESLITKYPDGISYRDIQEEIRKQGLSKSLYHIANGERSVGDIHFIEFFAEISNFLCIRENKSEKYIFLPITKTTPLDYQFFIDYPEVYDIRKRAHPEVSEKFLSNTDIHYFNNDKSPQDRGISGAGEQFFVSEKESDTAKQWIELNELTSRYFDESVGNRSQHKNHYREGSCIYYFITSDFDISNDPSDGDKVASAKINELRGDLLCLKYYPTKEVTQHVIKKGLRYLFYEISIGNQPTNKRSTIGQYFKRDGYDSYVSVGEFIAKNLKELYTIYGLEDNYNKLIERTENKLLSISQREIAIYHDFYYETELSTLMKKIEENPSLLQDRAKKEFNCINQNLIDILEK